MAISTQSLVSLSDGSAYSHEKTPPLVTASVVCYNHAKFVVEALESVKAQAYPNLQLVVVDDCSTDDSVKLIQLWLDQHWPDSVFVAHKTNMGVCRTANEALALSKGKYIRHLSADDRWIPNTLSRQIEVMEAVSEDIGVLYSDAFHINESGELLPQMFIETYRSFAEKPEGLVFNTLLEGNFIPGMTAVVRLRCFEAVGGFDESLVFEDWDLWLRIARQFKFKYFPEPSACYRLVQTSMARTRNAEIVESERRIVAKCLRSGWIASETGRETTRTDYLKARLAYRHGVPDPVLEAAWALRHRVCIKHAVLLLFVMVGLPNRRFERLVSFVNNIVNKAKFLFANLGIGRAKDPFGENGPR